MIRAQIEQYYGKEHLLRQDLVKHLIAKKAGDLSTIKEGSIDASIRSVNGGGEPADRNNHGVLLSNKLKRQLQHRSEVIDLDDHPALKVAVKMQMLERKHSADDLILKPVSGFFKNDIDSD